MDQSCAQRDLVGDRRSWWLLWGLPMAALVVGLLVGPLARALLWTPAFLLMGAACVYNAAHCGRLHCHITGPLYILAAVATVLLALGAVPIEWSWIATGVVAGTVLGYAPEWVRGKYAS